MALAVPTRVEYYDGATWTTTEDFEDYDSAAEWVRQWLGWDAVDEERAVFIPAWDEGER